jgi:hypothetical protein
VLLCAKYTSEADALVSNPNPICGQPLVLVEPMRPALASARCVNGLCSVGESPGPHRTVAQAALLASVRPWMAGGLRDPAQPQVPRDRTMEGIDGSDAPRSTASPRPKRVAAKLRGSSSAENPPHSPFDEVVHMHVFVTTC